MSDESPDVGRVFRSLSSATPSTAPAKKLWLSDLSAFSTNHLGTWIIGRSRKPCLTQAEALESARADAAHSIGDRLGSSLSVDIHADQLEVDSFAQQFVRPYGTIWTASVLIDVSSTKLNSLLARRSAELDKEHIRVARMRTGAALVIATAWLLYLLLNAITKGYFTTPLRVSAMIITTVAIVFLT